MALRRLALRLETRLPRQQRDADDAEEVQAHQDDEDACHHRQRLLPDAQQPADGRGAGAERDEDGGEAEHEGERGEDERRPRA